MKKILLLLPLIAFTFTAKADIAIGEGDSIQCSYNSKAYQDRVICLPGLVSTNYGSSTFSRNTIQISDGEKIDCSSAQYANKTISCSSYSRAPQVPTTPVYVTVKKEFKVSPNMRCIRNMSPARAKDLVGGDAFSLGLKGDALRCKNKNKVSVKGRRGGFVSDDQNLYKGFAGSCRVVKKNYSASCFNEAFSKITEIEAEGSKKRKRRIRRLKDELCTEVVQVCSKQVLDSRY